MNGFVQMVIMYLCQGEKLSDLNNRDPITDFTRYNRFSAYSKSMLTNRLWLKLFESLASLGLTEFATMESDLKEPFWKFSMQVIAVVVLLVTLGI